MDRSSVIQFPENRFQNVKGRILTINNVPLTVSFQANRLSLTLLDGTPVLDNVVLFTDAVNILDVSIEDTTAPQNMTVMIAKEAIKSVNKDTMQSYESLQQAPSPNPSIEAVNRKIVTEARTITDYLNIGA